MQSNLSASFSLLSSLFVAAPNLPSNYKTWLCLASTHTHTHKDWEWTEEALVCGRGWRVPSKQSLGLPSRFRSYSPFSSESYYENKQTSVLFLLAKTQTPAAVPTLVNMLANLLFTYEPWNLTKKQGKVEQEKAVHECTTSSHILKSEYFINP